MNSIFRVGYLARVPLKTPYPNIVATVGQMLARLPRWTPVAIDYTGVGRPVFACSSLPASHPWEY